MSRTIEVSQTPSRNQRIRVRRLGAAVLSAGITLGAGVAGVAEATHGDADAPHYGYYEVQPGENPTTIGRELGDGNKHILEIADEIGQQVDKNGNLQPAQIVRVNEAYVDHTDLLVPAPESSADVQ